MIGVTLDATSRRLRLQGPELVDAIVDPANLHLRLLSGFLERGHADVEYKLRDPGRDLTAILRGLTNASLEFELDDESRRILTAYADEMRLQQQVERGTAPPKVQLPSGLRRQPTDKQLPCIDHLIALPFAANFSVPGSGKTAMVLTAFFTLREAGEIDQLLVVAPTSSFESWHSEFQTVLGRAPNALTLTGTFKDRRQALAQTDDVELILCTYHMLPRIEDDLEGVLGRKKVLFVLDESHHIKRGEGGIWSEAALRLGPLAKRRIILTGTPMPQAVDDLRAQFEFLWPSNNPINRLPAEPSISEVRAVIRPYYRRISKAQLPLGKKTETRHSVKMGPLQARIYAVIAGLMRDELSREDRDFQDYVVELRKAVVVRLLQAASNPGLFAAEVDSSVPPLPVLDPTLRYALEHYAKHETPPKIAAAVGLVRELHAKQPGHTLAWTNFVGTARRLEQELRRAGVPTIVVTGERATADGVKMEREEAIQAYRKAAKPTTLVATLGSLGEGINLQRLANHAIYVERNFNAGQYVQSMDRIHRLGMDPNQTVVYHHLVCENSIDGVVDASLQRKAKAMFNALDDDFGVLDLDSDIDAPGYLDLDDVRAIVDHLKQVVGGTNAPSA